MAWDRIGSTIRADPDQIGDDGSTNADSLLASFKIAARHLAHQIHENVVYIRAELPSLGMDSPSAEQIEKLCVALIGAKHDVNSELNELDEMTASVPSPEMRDRVKRIVSWVGEEMSKFDRVVRTFQSEENNGPPYQLVFLLLAGSGVNILNAYNDVVDLAARYAKAQECDAAVTGDASHAANVTN